MKLQSLVERQRLGGLWDFGDQDCLRAPIGFQVRTYQLELQSFKLSLPAGYITNRESPCLAVDEEATRIVPRSLEISLSISYFSEGTLQNADLQLFQMFWNMERFSI